MKKILLIIVVLEILFMSIFGRKIDYFLIQKNSYPVFSFPLVRYKDGGTTVFYGTTYKIIALQSLSSNSKGIDGYITGTFLLNWFQKVELDKYLNDKNNSKFIEDNKCEDMNNGYLALVSFLIHLQIFISAIFLIIRNTKNISPKKY